MKFRLYILFIVCAIATTMSAQFIDIEWNAYDTIVPYYSTSYDIGYNYNNNVYDFKIEYPETEIATEEEIKRYNLDIDNLSENFGIEKNIGTSKNQGILNVSVFPFAKKDKKIVKLISFKPAFSSIPQKQMKKGLRTASLQYKQNSVLASGKWVKIRVKEEGVYQLSSQFLTKLGFKDPSKVALYGYGLSILPESYIHRIYDDLEEIPLWRRSDNTLLFYSPGAVKWEKETSSTLPIKFTHKNNPYSNYIYYFITEKTNPKPFPSEQIPEGEETSTFPDYKIIEKDEFSYINVGKKFLDSYDYKGGNSQKYSFKLDDIADTKAVVHVAFATAGANSSTLNINANGGSLGSLSFSKLGGYQYGVLRESAFIWKEASENAAITLTHDRESNISGHLDFIQIDYTRNLKMAGQFLHFRPLKKGALKYILKDATQNTKIWRVTSVPNVTEVKGTYTGTTCTASAKSLDGSDVFVAVNVDGKFPEPESVGTISNQNLHSLKDIDYVIITPASGKLNNEAKRLAEAHAYYDKMRCCVVQADQIYNEFSSGTPDITAYRRFLQMLYYKDSTENKINSPKNVCLFGSCVWDNRMVTHEMAGKSQDDYLLCYESEDSWSTDASYVLEDYITILDSTKNKMPELELMDCGVGRITVTTPNQAKAVVDKLIKYISHAYDGSWQNTICLIADDGAIDKGDYTSHMNHAEVIEKQVRKECPNINIRKIYFDSYTRVQTGTGSTYPGVTTDINHQMEEGALIMNYAGHGAAYCLSHEQVVKRSDFAEWKSDKLPFWIQMACDVSPIDMNTENIGETALLNPSGGAMGLLTSTRTVYAFPNQNLNKSFIEYVLNSNGQQNSLGEALEKAKNALGTSDRNKLRFVLLGDPAIHLPLPTYSIQIDSVNGHAVTDICDSIKAGATMNVKGHIVTSNKDSVSGFNGIVSSLVLDNLEKIVCKNNAGFDYDNYEYYDRTRTIFSGTDSIRNGQFSFTIPVPLDINYSLQSGLISLYAINNNHSLSANGTFEKFVLGGTIDSLTADTLGPQIQFILQENIGTYKEGNNEFICKRPVPRTPTFSAQLTDASGINTTGSGIGHNITLVIDNNENMTYTLNNYYKNATGTWTEGNISYVLPELPLGEHKLRFQVWDIMNNPSTINVTFTVIDDFFDYTLYDLTGREIWRGKDNSYMQSLQKGIYIRKSAIETKKILIK